MSVITRYVEILENFDRGNREFYFLGMGTPAVSSMLDPTSESNMDGMYANIKVYAKEMPFGWEFDVSGNNYADLGKARMVCDILKGMSSKEINRVVWNDFVPIGKLLEKEDKQLIQSVLNKCKQLAKENK